MISLKSMDIKVYSGKAWREMSGILYLCATPIGNLEDITFRVVNTLKEVDLIAAEDTRHSKKLLNHFEINTPMTSYHEHNKEEKGKYLISRLQMGKNIALITDAGTPGISDPGEDLVKLAYEAGIKVTSLPGACALITGLTLSGLSSRRFSFEAFLPRDNKERKRILNGLIDESRTIIFYESPHRLKRTLIDLHETLGDRAITIVRELTKIHETVHRTCLLEAIKFYETNEARGEHVLIIEGKSYDELEQELQSIWEEKTISEHMRFYMDQGFPKKEAMKSVAKDRGISKRDVYRVLLDESEGK